MRAEKESIVSELKERVSEATYMIVADYRGLTVSQAQDLRGKLGASQSAMVVVKNSFLQVATKGMSFEEMAGDLTGPSAVIYGNGDVVQLAKALRAFIKENELPIIKTGSLRGSALSAEDIEKLAGLPSREQLLAMVVGTIAAPLSSTVGVLSQKLSSLVYVLRAVQEKKGQ